MLRVGWTQPRIGDSVLRHGNFSEGGLQFADDVVPQRLGQVVSHPVEEHQPGTAGSHLATARPPHGRISLSARPWMTTVGAVIWLVVVQQAAAAQDRAEVPGTPAG